ncbi:hypothetical protein BU16DRAFT_541964 [Lophium mytilinum]|uniref:Uncharacterized protein n=1 Tax=Lophium mytilinum TaxID=390894 RepID=A0A6A6QJ62_9PEZI|nr:hypothetical protein BU16DRAFT_541964 [Lophium mytilinum]
MGTLTAMLHCEPPPFNISIDYYDYENNVPVKKGGTFSFDQSSIPIKARCSHLLGDSTTCADGGCYNLVPKTLPIEYGDSAFECKNKVCRGHRSVYRRCYTTYGLLLTPHSRKLESDWSKIKRKCIRHKVDDYVDIKGKPELNKTIRKIRAAKRNTKKPFGIRINQPTPEEPTKERFEWVTVNQAHLPLDARCDHLQSVHANCTVGKCYRWQPGTPASDFGDYVYTCENEACWGHTTKQELRCYGDAGVVPVKSQEEVETTMGTQAWTTHSVEGWKAIEGRIGLNEKMEQIAEYSDAHSLVELYRG